MNISKINSNHLLNYLGLAILLIVLALLLSACEDPEKESLDLHATPEDSRDENTKKLKQKYDDLKSKYYSKEAVIKEFKLSIKDNESTNIRSEKNFTTDAEKSFESLKNDILSNNENTKKALSAIGMTGNPDAIPILILALREGNFSKEAKRGLTRMGYAATDALLTLLASDDEALLKEVFEVLGNVGDPKAILPIYDYLLTTKNTKAKEYAARALRSFPSRAAIRGYFSFVLEGIDNHRGYILIDPAEPLVNNPKAPEELLIFTKAFIAYMEYFNALHQHMETMAEMHQQEANRYWKSEDSMKANEHGDLFNKFINKHGMMYPKKSNLDLIFSSILEVIKTSGNGEFRIVLDHLSNHPSAALQNHKSSVAKAYGSLRNITVSESMAKILKSEDENAILETIKSLSSFNTGEPITYLVDLIGHSNPKIDRATKQTISKLSKENNIFDSLASFAEILIKENDKDALNLLAEKVFLLYGRELDSVLAYGNEAQRLTFSEQFSGRRHPYAITASTANPDLILRSILRIKGIILDSLIEDRIIKNSLANSQLNELSMKLDTMRSKYQGLNVDERSSEIGLSLSREISTVESQINRLSSQYGRSRRSKSVDAHSLSANLTDAHVALEFIKYPSFNDGKWVDQYGVIAFRSHNGQPDYKWVELGLASKIDKDVQLYHASIENKIHPKIESLSKQLHSVLWKPLEGFLSDGVETVYVAPDSVLGYVSFSTLANKDSTLLGELYDFVYISSLRDLLNLSSKSTKTKNIGIFSAPDFHTSYSGEMSNNPDTELLRNVDMDKMRNINLSPLPGTTEEAEFIVKIGSRNNVKVSHFSGQEATEATFRGNGHFGITHLATHGFFLPPLNEDSHGIDPMLRSGFALSGANQTFELWGEGKYPPPGNDGIITAYEISLMDLSKSSLIVLSACDTGIGSVVDGEGIFGLKRGFSYAGAQNVLLTLWPISDQYAAGFMRDFYQILMEGNHSPSEAFSVVQRQHFKTLKEEKSLAHSIMLVGPFVINQLGNAVR